MGELSKISPKRIPDYVYRNNISSYNIELALYPDRLEVLDAFTGNILKKHPMDPENYVIHKIEKHDNKYFAWKSKRGSTYEVLLNVLGLSDTISTNDEYIFAVQYEHELELGGHFGYYGWGLFSIKSNKIYPYFSQQTEKLMTGQISKKKNKVIIILGYSTGLIEAFEIDPEFNLFKLNLNDCKLWDITDEQGISDIKIIKGMIVSSHLDGCVKIRNINSGEPLQSIQVSKTQAKCLTHDSNFCYIGTLDGVAVGLETQTWDLIWRTKLSKLSIERCAVLKDGVCFVDNGYGIYWLAPHNGEIHQKVQSKIGVSSNPVQFKKWVLVGGAASLLVFHGKICMENHEWQDNLIRAIHYYPYKILVGNDNGNLSLWTYPGVIIKKNNKVWVKF